MYCEQSVVKAPKAEESEIEVEQGSLLWRCFMSWSEEPEWAPPTGKPQWNGRILPLKAKRVLSDMRTLNDEGT